MIEHLKAQGYTIDQENRGRSHGVDILATKDGRKLYVEIKGDSAALDVDFGTLLFQIMRCMMAESTDEFAICISEKYTDYARQCVYSINKLGIDVFVISESGVKRLL